MRLAFAQSLVAVCLLLSPLASAKQVDRPMRSTPLLPRALYVGSFFNDAVTPQLRAQWQYTLLQERVDALVVFFEGGGGISSFELPRFLGRYQMTRFYQAT